MNLLVQFCVYMLYVHVHVYYICIYCMCKRVFGIVNCSIFGISLEQIVVYMYVNIVQLENVVVVIVVELFLSTPRPSFSYCQYDRLGGRQRYICVVELLMRVYLCRQNCFQCIVCMCNCGRGAFFAINVYRHNVIGANRLCSIWVFIRIQLYIYYYVLFVYMHIGTAEK